MSYTLSSHHLFGPPPDEDTKKRESLTELIQSTARTSVFLGNMAEMVRTRLEMQQSDARAHRAVKTLIAQLSDDVEEDAGESSLFMQGLRKVVEFVGGKFVEYVARPIFEFAIRAAMGLVRFALRGIVTYVIEPVMSAIVGFCLANPITAGVMAALLVAGGGYYIWRKFFKEDTNAPTAKNVKDTSPQEQRDTTTGRASLGSNPADVQTLTEPSSAISPVESTSLVGPSTPVATTSSVTGSSVSKVTGPPTTGSNGGKGILGQELAASGLSKNVQAAIAGNVAVESGYKAQSEDLANYANTSNDRIRKIFKTKMKGVSDAQLNELKKDPKRFGDFVYSDIGGYEYRGRGFNQLTGIDNYRRYSRILFGDDRLVKNPDLVNDPHIAAKIVIAYTKDRAASLARKMFGKDLNALTYKQASEVITQAVAGEKADIHTGYLKDLAKRKELAGLDFDASNNSSSTEVASANTSKANPSIIVPINQQQTAQVPAKPSGTNSVASAGGTPDKEIVKGPGNTLVEVS